MIGTGAGALRSIGSPCAPSVSTSWSCTIFTTSWPGVTDLMTSTPTALAFTFSVKPRTTSSATSASSSARRTSRIAASTSASVSAPRRVRRSRIPPSRSDRLSNIIQTPMAPEGASRCRAGASGLTDRSADCNSGSCESARNLWWHPREVKKGRQQMSVRDPRGKARPAADSPNSRQRAPIIGAIAPRGSCASLGPAGQRKFRQDADETSYARAPFFVSLAAMSVPIAGAAAGRANTPNGRSRWWCRLRRVARSMCSAGIFAQALAARLGKAGGGGKPHRRRHGDRHRVGSEGRS